MKQSTVIFLVLITLLSILFTSCVDGQSNKNKRSLLFSGTSSATLAITDYEKGGDSGGPAACDGMYHSNDLYIVSLPRNLYNDGKNCYNHIYIFYKDNFIRAMVIDESDTDNTIVASKAVWRFLQIPESGWGELDVTWSWAP
ncbi:putative ripening-related protein 2 [Tanacetum coccineum]